MATAPKAAPKAVAVDDGAGKKSNKTLIIVLVAVLVALAAGGGAAWFFLKKSGGDSHGAAAPAHAPAPAYDPGKPPVFLAMESFTVNLAQDGFGDQYLQTQFTLQVPDQAQVDLIKLYMPLVRSRILLLLSSKKASEIATPDGKTKLSEEIIELVKKPFNPNAAPQQVAGVFFTSFVIQ
jgi:flagellar FliL protein